MHIDQSQRRWFVDIKPGWEGRLIEVYALDEQGNVMASVHWRRGRPVGTRRSWYGKLATLEGERMSFGRRNLGRGGERPLRYRELAGEELERVRRGEVREVPS